MRGAAAFALIALGCASLPPDPDSGVSDAGPADAAPDAPIAPACVTPRRDIGNRDLVVFEHTEPGVGSVAWTFSYIEVAGTRGIVEVALVGAPGALEDTRRPIELGGVEADLASCRHCVVFWPDCDGLPSQCTGDPWVARAGRAFVFDAPSGTETEFDVELGQLELVPAEYDSATLRTNPREGQGCVHLDQMRLSGRVEETDCTFSQLACQLTLLSDR